MKRSVESNEWLSCCNAKPTRLHMIAAAPFLLCSELHFYQLRCEYNRSLGVECTTLQPLSNQRMRA